MLSVATLCIGIFTCLIVKFFLDKWNLYKSVKIQGPGLYPFVIEFFLASYRLAKSDFDARLKIMTDAAWDYNGPVKFWFGLTLSIILNTPEHFHKVLNAPQCLEKWNLFYNTIERSGGLIFGSVKNKWKEHRKILNVLFGKSYLESYKTIYESSAKKLIQDLEKTPEGSEVDIFKFIRPITLNIVLESCTGRNIFGYSRIEELMESVRMSEIAFAAKTRLPYIYPQTLYKLTETCRKEKEAHAHLKEFLTELVDETRKNFLLNNNDRKPKFILEQIIANDEKFTDKEIRDNLVDFMFAGESITISLSNTILMLAMHPEVQENLYNELQIVLDDDYEVMDRDSMLKCEYMEMIFKETSRRFPVVPVILRETLSNFELEPGVIIPEEICFVLNFHALYNNQAFWGDFNVNEFIPERFNAENSKILRPNLLLPFSGGQRNCIAYKYSVDAYKIVLARLVRKYKFSTKLKMSDIKMKLLVSMKLIGPHAVTIERRN